MEPEKQSIDVLKLRRGIPNVLRNYDIETVGDLMDHCTGAKIPVLFAMPSIGEERYRECTVKAARYLAAARWRISLGIKHD